MEEKTRVLFLCTHNSARSQMAQAWLNSLAGERFDAHSAGLEPGRVHPLTLQVLSEAGLDMRAARSKSLQEYSGGPAFDYLITVCSSADERCPYFPGQGTRLHWPFEDPSSAAGTEEERLAVFRAVRDSIRLRIEEWLATPEKDHGSK